ncbi:putative T7SS-secreted protein, partial [Angustibacter peucedani]
MTAVPRAFPTAACGADVVPGRPERVAQVADQLRTLSDGLLRWTAVLRGLVALDWHGLARQALPPTVDLDAEPAARAGALMAQAADHLATHARVLGAAQARADDALRLDVRVPLAASPAAAVVLRTVVEQEVQAARQAVRVSGAGAAEGLRTAAALAPVAPGVLGRMTGAARSFGRDEVVGALEAQTQLLAVAARFSGVRLLLDPGGYVDDGEALTRASLHRLTHPREAVADQLDVATWHENHGRWSGHQAVALALGVAGGAGSAGSGARAATLPARAIALLPGSRGATLRAAVRERPVF